MAGQSLFRATQLIIGAKASGVEKVEGNNISFEYYTQADIDANVAAIVAGTATKCTFGDADESKVVVVADETITIPAGFSLMPANPKKSLVICCNTLINNGTISMTGKGPNVLPHDWFILGEDDYAGSDIVIPAYANNRVERSYASNNGNNGTNRNCGSGGKGSNCNGLIIGATGSGYAFGGGAGSGGAYNGGINVDSTYPMRGSNGESGGYAASGGVGNPSGANSIGYGVINVVPNNTGVGGRLIIYCVDFENNGIISADGVATKRCYTILDGWGANWGGASGAGAIDIFYTNLVSEGTNTATGGGTFSAGTTPGKGGNGSITLLNWTIDKLVKPEKKLATNANWFYLFSDYAVRFKNSEE